MKNEKNDLHDYSDVAENYDRYLEVMYRDFDAQHRVITDGTDLSEEMCRVCSEKAVTGSLKLMMTRAR